MTLKYRFLIATFLISTLGISQSKQKVDSLNAIEHSILISDLALNKQLFLENIVHAKQLNYQEGVAKSKVNLSIILFYLKEEQKGLKYSVEATQYYESQENWSEMANSYADIGYIFKETNLKLALNYFRKALQIYQAHDVDKVSEKILNNYGVLQMMKTPKDIDSAIYYHKKAYEVATNLNLKIAIPYSLNNLVTAYSAKENYEKAFYYLDLSDSYRKYDTLSLDWADNLAYRADVYFDMKRYQKAIFYYEKSETLAKQNNFINLVKFCLDRLSTSNEKLGQTSEALFYLKALQNYKDSIGTIETNVAIAKIQENYNVSQKEQQILKQEAKIIGQKNKILWLIIGFFILLVLGYLIYRKIKRKQQKLKQQLALEKIESEKNVQLEKLRISRDLHDNIGSQLTYVISSLDNLNYIKDETKRQSRLEDLEVFTKNTLNELRETIWTIKMEDITLNELYLKVLEYTNRFDLAIHECKLTTLNNDLNKEYTLKGNQAINLFRTIQEAITNSIKYSHSKKIQVKFYHNTITIIDNGVGFNKKEVKKGNGIINMNQRIISDGNDFKIDSTLGGGTSITINLR